MGSRQRRPKGPLPRRSCPSPRKFTALDANVTKLDGLVADSLSRNEGYKYPLTMPKICPKTVAARFTALRQQVRNQRQADVAAARQEQANQGHLRQDAGRNPVLSVGRRNRKAREAGHPSQWMSMIIITGGYFYNKHNVPRPREVDAVHAVVGIGPHEWYASRSSTKARAFSLKLETVAADADNPIGFRSRPRSYGSRRQQGTVLSWSPRPRSRGGDGTR